MKKTVLQDLAGQRKSKSVPSKQTLCPTQCWEQLENHKVNEVTCYKKKIRTLEGAAEVVQASQV